MAEESDLIKSEEVCYLRFPAPGRATWIAMWYALISSTWIFGSGWLLHFFVHDPVKGAFLEDVKGWLFVVLTALLLRFAVERSLRSARISLRRIADSEARLRVVGDNLPDSYVFQYSRNSEGKPQFTYISAGVERVHGLTSSQVLRDPNCFLALIDSKVRADFVAAEKQSAQNLTDFEITLPILRRQDEQSSLSQHSGAAQAE